MTFKYTHIRILMPFAVAVLLLIGAFWLLFSPYLPLTQMPLSTLRRSNESMAAEIQKIKMENSLLNMNLAAFEEMRSSAMTQQEQPGTVAFRERIDAAALKAGLRSRTTGNVRCMEVENEAMVFEVTLSADGTTSEIITFLDSLDSEKPKVYWRTLSILPSGSGEFLNISGTLAALSFPEGGIQHENPEESPEGDRP